MKQTILSNWPAVPLLLAAAACAPRAESDADRLLLARTTDTARPAPTAPDGDCGSASVHDSRRDGTVDCFYNWNEGLAACRYGREQQLTKMESRQ